MDNDIQGIIDRSGYRNEPDNNFHMHNLLEMLGIIAQEIRDHKRTLERSLIDLVNNIPTP